MITVLCLATCFIAPQGHGLLIYITQVREPWPLLRHERLEVVFNDGFTFYVTSHHADHIDCRAARLDWIVRNVFRRDMSSIRRLTHNHFSSKDLSDQDRAFRQDLKVYGFRGQFVIWFDGQLFYQ